MLKPMSEAPRDGRSVLVKRKADPTCWMVAFPHRADDSATDGYCAYPFRYFSGFIAPLPPDATPASLLRFAGDVAAVLDDEGKAALVCSLLSDGAIGAAADRVGKYWEDDANAVSWALHKLRETTDEG